MPTSCRAAALLREAHETALGLKGARPHPGELSAEGRVLSAKGGGLGAEPGGFPERLDEFQALALDGVTGAPAGNCGAGPGLLSGLRLQDAAILGHAAEDGGHPREAVVEGLADLVG